LCPGQHEDVGMFRAAMDVDGSKITGDALLWGSRLAVGLGTTPGRRPDNSAHRAGCVGASGRDAETSSTRACRRPGSRGVTEFDGAAVE